MIDGIESVRIIGCIAPQAGSWLYALALVGFVLAARAVSPPVPTPVRQVTRR